MLGSRSYHHYHLHKYIKTTPDVRKVSSSISFILIFVGKSPDIYGIRGFLPGVRLEIPATPWSLHGWLGTPDASTC